MAKGAVIYLSRLANARARFLDQWPLWAGDVLS
jgi:hypothetical protein